MIIAEIILNKYNKTIYSGEYEEKITRMMISSFIYSLKYSGQIVYNSDMIEHERLYKIFVNIYEKKSLNKCHNNIYVDKNIEDLKSNYISIEKCNILGKSLAGKEPCSCKEYDYFILYKNILFIDSPIRCGKCFLPIPLYKIRKDKKKNFDFLYTWEDNYESLYHLYIDSGKYGKFAYKQLSKYDSEINFDGIYCCDSIYNETRVKTYYYLDNFENKKIYKLCPKCKMEWKLKEKIHDIFSFRCDKCFFIA